MPKLTLSPDELRTLVACADTGSFSAAAQRVHRTQSTVSGQVARIEQMLGGQAFHRTGRGVTPTSLGEPLLAYARRLLALQDEMNEVVFSVQPSGELRIGLSEYVAPSRIGGCLQTLSERFPQLRVSVQMAQSTSLLRRFEADDLDLMIGTSLVGALPLGTALGQERLRWVSNQRRNFESGDDVPLVLLESTCSIHQDALARLTAAGLRPRVVMTVSGALAVQVAVAAGAGLGYLNESAIPSSLTSLNRTSGLPEAGEVHLYVLRRESGLAADASKIVLQTLLANLELAAPIGRAR